MKPLKNSFVVVKKTSNIHSKMIHTKIPIIQNQIIFMNAYHLSSSAECFAWFKKKPLHCCCNSSTNNFRSNTISFLIFAFLLQWHLHSFNVLEEKVRWKCLCFPSIWWNFFWRQIRFLENTLKSTCIEEKSLDQFF